MRVVSQYIYAVLVALNVAWLLYTATLAYRIRHLEYNNKEARAVSISVLIVLASSAVAFSYLFADQSQEGAREQVTRATLLVLIASTGAAWRGVLRVLHDSLMLF